MKIKGKNSSEALRVILSILEVLDEIVVACYFKGTNGRKPATPP